MPSQRSGRKLFVVGEGSEHTNLRARARPNITLTPGRPKIRTGGITIAMLVQLIIRLDRVLG